MPTLSPLLYSVHQFVAVLLGQVSPTTTDVFALLVIYFIWDIYQYLEMNHYAKKERENFEDEITDILNEIRVIALQLKMESRFSKEDYANFY